LARLLDSLRHQDIGYEAFETIVVDDGSTDETPALLGNLKLPYAVRTFRQENQGPAAARNLGIQAACSDVIVTLDDDVEPTPGLLAQHIRAHKRSHFIAAMGPMVLPRDQKLQPWLEWEARTLERQYRDIERGLWSPTPRQFYTANASFKRSIALEVGLFDSDFRRAEDVEFAYRLSDRGVGFEFLPSATVHHVPNRTYGQWLGIPELYGHYDVVMTSEKGRSHILNVMASEFARRRLPLRIAARFLVGRRRILGMVVKTAGIVANLMRPSVVRPLSHASYSFIFNLLYWQGICDALGSRIAFWNLIRYEASRRNTMPDLAGPGSPT
jgi:GT2 family glycosyltransferase